MMQMNFVADYILEFLLYLRTGYRHVPRSHGQGSHSS